MDSSVYNVCIYLASVVATLVLMIVSTMFTVKNIMRILGTRSPAMLKPTVAVQDADGNLKEMYEIDSSSDEDQTLETGPPPENQGTNSDLFDENISKDPMEYCEHIQSEVKKAKHRIAAKRISEKLTPQQIQEEREIQQQQLEAIFKLMKQEEDKFGMSSMKDVEQQLKLYLLL